MTALARRAVVPERLDALPPGDPDAVASRRDLRRLNRIMGHAGIAARLVRRHAAGPLRRVADLGCGDGIATWRAIRRLGPPPEGGRLALVDAAPAVAPEARAGLEALGWKVETVTADVFGWLDRREDGVLDLVTANLFLHHFPPAALADLLARLSARARLLVATEPLRAPLAHLASRSLGVLGANAVTRHDAPVSVRAGFRDAEISSLWPGTTLFEGRRGPFVHAFAGRGAVERDGTA